MRDKQHQKNPTNADLTRKETTELKRYKKYITPYLSAFVIGPLMMLTEVAGEVMLPKFMSMIINNVFSCWYCNFHDSIPFFYINKFSVIL